MEYINKNTNDTVSITLLATEEQVGVAGLTPTIEIRRQSDSAYLNFNATTAPYWVQAGGQPLQTLTEATYQAGVYTWQFDHAILDTDAQDEYMVIYRNTGAYTLLALEMMSFTKQADLTLVRKLLANDQDLATAGDGFIHTVFDDDKTTPIHTKQINLVAGVEERRDVE